YADYKDLMALTENMLEKLAIDILGTTDVPYQGEVFSFKGPFKTLSLFPSLFSLISLFFFLHFFFFFVIHPSRPQFYHILFVCSVICT
ncbi:hypothetical protein, partial [Acinetobacter baumannii]|uniref:hypothetical protein n=1 Tax=Acinetobacter baumannii TaxID=470 RepID=UPI001C45ADEF